MKKIGTLTSAAGLIFYGVWLILKNVNYAFSIEVFKWWPIILVTLGLEIVYFNREKTGENKKIGINYFIIPIILLFLFTNIYCSAKNGISSFIGNEVKIDRNAGDFFKKDDINIDDFNFENKDKKVKGKKELKSYGKDIELELPNGKIEIKNGTNDKIVMDFNVYVDKSNSIDEYEINEQKEAKGYKISLSESYVNGVSGIIYVPKGYYTKVNGANLKLNTRNDFLGDVDIKGSNCDINLNGDIKNSIIDISNGKINLKNNICKNIKINACNGAIAVDTKDKNMKVDVNMDNGVCRYNNEKRVNAGLSRVVGNGEGTIKIDMNNGVVNIKSRE